MRISVRTEIQSIESILSHSLSRPTKLPAHDGQAMFDEERDGQALGQDVCLLVRSINFVYGDVTLFHVLTEMTELYIEMLGARSDLVYGCNLERATVVFKDFAVHCRLGRLYMEALVSNFAK